MARGGVDRLEVLWENFRLSKEESLDLEVNEVEDAMKDKGDRSLVGKVCLDRVIGKEILSSMMAKIWKISKAAVFQEVGTNIFIITFHTIIDLEKVWEGRLWLFDNHLLALRVFDTGAQPGAMKFEEEVFWIQLHNLPMGFMDESRGFQIGGSVGRVWAVDVPPDGVGWGRFLRVRVEVPLRKPIARGRLITVNGKKVWVGFKYEKLLRMCFTCGWVVHGEDGCKGGGSMEAMEPQFGAWLRAEKNFITRGVKQKSRWDYSTARDYEPGPQ
ncbi:uncharacterized protein LOC118349286 [Juglans regia]|uniref:Uncharacterized protein LOC118349286 n=1 Tax=Juglans regia TaxID=51240 RepID=A0A6P9EL56_JUGRE|nr:uncharacterized protein LOC118349286 [Juglans regia]